MGKLKLFSNYQAKGELNQISNFICNSTSETVRLVKLAEFSITQVISKY